MEQKFYTNERNVQILIAVLKANGIRKVIVSPGTTNITFVGSIQQDPFFEIYSSVDERSAAYIACGMAAESGEAVVLSCTGATASRNYFSGLTEAFYRKLPILAVTSHQGTDRIGHLIAQNIDRRQLPNDIVKLSVDIPVVHDTRDEHYAEIEANKATLELFRKGGGPVHINLHTRYSRDFSVRELPPCQIIRRYSNTDLLPELPKGRIAIFVGSHKSFTEEETTVIDAFCAEHNSVVLCDHTSGYYGKYRVQSSILFTQRGYKTKIDSFDLLIHIGEVSGDYTSESVRKKQVWRVSPDGEVRDTFGLLSYVFEMSEVCFFKAYTKENSTQVKTDLFVELSSEVEKVRAAIPELSFCNIWVAQQTASRIPEGSRIYLGILNTLRVWNFFDFPKTVKSFSNVGGFGIDGTASALLGASLINPNRLYFGVMGDLAFFYDMNVFGNRHVARNLRILLINNGKGTEFKMYNHPCSAFGDDAEPYMAAAGHYGNKSSSLVRHYAEDLGYEYLTASTKEEYLKVLDYFLTPEITDKSMIFEVFTNSIDESDMLKKFNSMMDDNKCEIKKDGARFVKNVLKKGCVSIKNKMMK